MACGEVAAPDQRLSRLLATQNMPDAWRAWLRLQLGLPSPDRE